MHYKEGTGRHQMVLYPEFLDEIISEDNPVRVIDAYVEHLDVEECGFQHSELKTGAPPYRAEVLIKLYMYGHINKLRTSRILESECYRNMEVRWLLEDLKPCFKTIADFRRKNREALNALFDGFQKICFQLGLIDFKEVAIDGTKVYAQNSTNNVYRRNEIDKVGGRIDKKMSEYLAMLDENDTNVEEEELKLKGNVVEVVKKLKALKNYKKKAEQVKREFEADPELKVYYATDPDARFQSDQGRKRVGYNAQIAVDNKNKLIVASSVTNETNDYHQMTPMLKMVKEAKENLGVREQTTAVMDSGYFSEPEIVKNKETNGIRIVVPDKSMAASKGKSKRQPPKKRFGIPDFHYDEETDQYICPAGYRLRRGYEKDERNGVRSIVYVGMSCNICTIKNECTKTKKRYRTIAISKHKGEIDAFKKTMREPANKEMIRKRKEIVEHPFGTIKQTFGYRQFLLRGRENVDAEFRFTCFIYNFKRMINITRRENTTNSLYKLLAAET